LSTAEPTNRTLATRRYFGMNGATRYCIACLREVVDGCNKSRASARLEPIFFDRDKSRLSTYSRARVGFWRLCGIQTPSAQFESVTPSSTSAFKGGGNKSTASPFLSLAQRMDSSSRSATRTEPNISGRAFATSKEPRAPHNDLPTSFLTARVVTLERPEIASSGLAFCKPSRDVMRPFQGFSPCDLRGRMPRCNYSPRGAAPVHLRARDRYCFGLFSRMAA